MNWIEYTWLRMQYLGWRWRDAWRSLADGLFTAHWRWQHRHQCPGCGGGFVRRVGTTCSDECEQWMRTIAGLE